MAIVVANIIILSEKPNQIINNPATDFVNDFIIKQLAIKKNNIFKLFGGENNAQ